MPKVSTLEPHLTGQLGQMRAADMNGGSGGAGALGRESEAVTRVDESGC